MNMNRFAGVHHEPKSKDCYPYDSDTLHFRIKTGKNDFEEVNLILSDPYFNVPNPETKKYEAPIEKITMKKECTTDIYAHWFAEAKVPRKRALYSFELIKGRNRYLYTRNHPVKLNSKSRYSDYARSSFYKFPYISSEDIFTAPEWAKDTVWYQIFVDRFAKSSHPVLVKDNLCEWDEPVQANDSQLYGGDLYGIVERLDYLQSLGITGIYLTPIFLAPLCHKYATTDYMMIDPAFGNEEILAELIEKAHKRGIRIMLDIVFNHCGNTHDFFQDAYEKGKKSKYYDCFYFDADNKYASFSDYGWMPKWNTGNSIAREYLLGAAAYWAKKGIDGFRLDVANEGSHDFWRDFRKTVKKVNSDIFIVGEVWEDAIPWLAGDQWDSAMHYPLSSAIHEYVKGNIDGIKLAEMISINLVSYPKNVTENLFTLLGSHDTTRILTYANGNDALVKQAFTLLMTMAGSPCFFYGDEIGLEGKGGDLARQCFKWNESEQNLDLREFVKKVIVLRKNNYAMRTVDITWLHAEKDHVIYEKSAQDKKIVVVMNCLGEENEIDISDIIHGAKAMDLLSGVELKPDKPLLTEAFSICLFQLL